MGRMRKWCVSVITGKSKHQEIKRPHTSGSVDSRKETTMARHILRMGQHRKLKQLSQVIFEVYKRPRQGNMLMDAPSTTSCCELTTLAFEREHWRARVRALKQPVVVRIVTCHIQRVIKFCVGWDGELHHKRMILPTAPVLQRRWCVFARAAKYDFVQSHQRRRRARQNRSAPVLTSAQNELSAWCWSTLKHKIISFGSSGWLNCENISLYYVMIYSVS